MEQINTSSDAAKDVAYCESLKSLSINAPIKVPRKQPAERKPRAPRPKKERSESQIKRDCARMAELRQVKALRKADARAAAASASLPC